MALHIRIEIFFLFSRRQEILFGNFSHSRHFLGNAPHRVALGNDQAQGFRLAAGQLFQDRVDAHRRIDDVLAFLDIAGLPRSYGRRTEQEGAGNIALFTEHIGYLRRRHVATNMDVASFFRQEKIRRAIGRRHEGRRQKKRAKNSPCGAPFSAARSCIAYFLRFLMFFVFF